MDVDSLRFPPLIPFLLALLIICPHAPLLQLLSFCNASLPFHLNPQASAVGPSLSASEVTRRARRNNDDHKS